jgi:hypothetical protein
VQTINELVDSERRILFGGLGQACIQCRGGGAGMTEQALDMAQA